MVVRAGNVPKFEVWCKAGKNGVLHVGGERVSVQIGQRVRRKGGEEMWHSVAVFADETEDGNLGIRVLVSNPDWDEPMQIASIVSRPEDSGCQTALGCNLDHVTCLPQAGLPTAGRPDRVSKERLNV